MRSLLLFIFFFIVTPNLWAAKVTQVKGKKALIDLETDSAFAGDRFFVVDEAGKKRGLLTIVQVKGQRAVADINKGSASAGFKLVLAKPGASTKSAEGRSKGDSLTSTTSIATKLQPGWGLMGNMIMGSMSAKFRGSTTSTTRTTNMAGTNFGFEGYYDYTFGNSWSLRMSGAYQMFNLSGSTEGLDCKGSNTCTVNISYLAGYGLMRYHFNHGQFATWAGLGGGMLLPVGTSSNVISTASINMVYGVAFGADYKLSRSHYIPFSFEYNIFPATTNVTSNMMILKAGYGWYF